ncbi:BnaCnng15920D [Brassica napus]|uniref:BnaCnng15920D protein n=1 Tax=Brassica napus TaxID=3708 RepID=A0A078IDY4_BRANA|nr:BnaCnng15920D [Brassica napus]
MEGKIFNGGAVGILEELIESAEEEVLLASCRLIKLYPELEHCVGVQTIMGCLPFEKFVEACKDPQDETNEMRAKTLHKVALKIGYYVKPWNSEASREASLQEIVDKVRTIAHRRKRNVIRRDD